MINAEEYEKYISQIFHTINLNISKILQRFYRIGLIYHNAIKFLSILQDVEKKKDYLEMNEKITLIQSLLCMITHKCILFQFGAVTFFPTNR